jgi:hypothetical protein
MVGGAVGVGSVVAAVAEDEDFLFVTHTNRLPTFLHVCFCF